MVSESWEDRIEKGQAARTVANRAEARIVSIYPPLKYPCLLRLEGC